MALTVKHIENVDDKQYWGKALSRDATCAKTVVVVLKQDGWIFLEIFLAFPSQNVTAFQKCLLTVIPKRQYCNNYISRHESTDGEAVATPSRQGSIYSHRISHTIQHLLLLNWHCLFVCGTTAPSGPGSPHSRGFYITHSDAPQSVGLLWTSDHLVAETSTWQHTTLTTDTYPCPLVGFEPIISVGERPQTNAVDRAANGTGELTLLYLIFKLKFLLQW
jgi:hypothetical protein